MNNVEDILRGLGSLVISRRIKDEWSKSFIQNVNSHVINQNALSTSQSETILKLANRYASDLHKVMRIDMPTLRQAIDVPRYRRTPYQSISVKREVRYGGENKLIFRFKSDPTVVSDIKALKTLGELVNNNTQPPYMFNAEHRVWVVAVTASNLEAIRNIITRHRFDYDIPVLEYITICHNSKNHVSSFELEPEANVIVANVINNPILAMAINRMGGTPL